MIWYKTIFRLIKQEFIALLSFSGSLASIASVSNFKTCISLNIQPWVTGPTLIELNTDGGKSKIVLLYHYD